jgi:excisionase family DNA binding protein
MNKLLNIREAADYLHVTPDCLRKWHRNGTLVPLKTAGGHRRYDLDELKKFVGQNVDEEEQNENCCVTYARVSSNA